MTSRFPRRLGTRASSVALVLLSGLSLALAACNNDPDEVADLDMTANDFSCILDWPKVDKFRIVNLLGHQADAEAVARSSEGGTYPVGTVIQLVPHEAMVKRQPGFSPRSGDWEFFLLDVSQEGTSIRMRGTEDVINDFGGNCLDCHAATEPKFDFVCSDDHGCEALEVTPEQLEAFQQSDPRCQ
ncbi:hypothetical protein [Haliangium sp.]|uniref:hypothetical protein n=1 Tax=Haliangium sp. TaxID=2663208 RepID=UPI003D12D8CB